MQSHETTASAAELHRLRRLLHEVAQCRQDATVVHEIVQQALGYDPDVEDHENAKS